MLLLKAQAGSHLYGYATDISDDDYFEVHTEPFFIPTRIDARPVRQTIVDGLDVTQMTLSHFMERAQSGSHQALDAMFAAEPEFDAISEIRASYRTGYEVIAPYKRIISKFALQEGFRKQRHSLRTLFNLTDMLATGRYKPELSDERIAFINEKAHLPYEEFRHILIELSPVDLEHLLPAK
jgi:hypothetical protein